VVNEISLGSLVLGSMSSAIVLQRLLELRVARRNEAWARERGAREFGREHYPWFFVLHPGWMLATVFEAISRGPSLHPAWPWLLGGFVAAGVLRYWAIATLGPRWNTRVLVLPGHPPLRRGPYKLLAHPNYLAVVVELAVVPLMFGAMWTALVFSVLNATLLLGVRIPCEVAALRWAEGASPTHGDRGGG